jgi:hypothetical protein
MKVGLLGALLGFVIIQVAVVVLHPAPPGPGSPVRSEEFLWVSLFVAMGLGAFGSRRVHGKLEAGNERGAWIHAALWAMLILLVPLAIAGIPLQDTRFSPASKRERSSWAESVTVRDQQGLRLARELQRCLRPWGSTVRPRSFLQRDCASFRASWYALGEDSLAAQRRYVAGDDGWRWENAADSTHLLVFPDPRVKRTGPVFEVRPFQVVRRQQRGAPPYATDQSVPMMARFHGCFSSWAKGMRSSGAWDGSSQTLPSLLSSIDTSCAAHLRVHTLATRANERSILEGRGGVFDGSFRVDYFPFWAPAEIPFILVFDSEGVSYAIDTAGVFHMRPVHRAWVNDSTPPRCVLDLTVPCD